MDILMIIGALYALVGMLVLWDGLRSGIGTSGGALAVALFWPLVIVIRLGVWWMDRRAEEADKFWRDGL